MLQLIGHGIADPGDLTAQGPLGFLDVHQPFLERKRFDVAVQFGMSKSLVYIVEVDPFGSVIAVDGLQPGDVPQEGRSGQAAKNQNRVVSLQAAQLEFFALGVKDREVGQRLTERGS